MKTLRHRIDIQRPIVEMDTNGAILRDWESLLLPGEPLFPAAIEPMTGRELQKAGVIVAEQSSKMTIRYDPRIAPEMRVVHGTAIYDIAAVIPDVRQRMYLELICTVGKNDG